MTQADPEFAAALKPAIALAPMDRMGTAQEVADTCLFLCSSKATFIQGHALVSFFFWMRPLDRATCTNVVAAG